MSKFPVCRCRNFEFELEISSWYVEISSLPKSKFRVCPNWKFRVQTRNFDIGKLEILTSQLEISSSNSKFRLRQTGNFDIPTGNFEFKLEISTSANWKFRHPNWKFSSSNSKFRLRQTGNFDIPTGNFDFKLEISTLANG